MIEVVKPFNVDNDINLNIAVGNSRHETKWKT